MTVTVVSSDGVALPSAITVTVPERGTIKDLIGALTASCSMREDETLLVAEVFYSSYAFCRIIAYYLGLIESLSVFC